MDGDSGLDIMVRHIRFELFTPELLAKGPVRDGAVSNEQLRELFELKYGDRPSTIFNRSMRLNLPATYRLSVNIFFGSDRSRTNQEDWKLLGTFQLVIWADVAPKTCQLLRDYVEGNHFIKLRQLEAGKGSLYCLRKVEGSQTGDFLRTVPGSHELAVVENASGLAASSGMVCVRKGLDGSLDLSILTTSQHRLCGLYPDSPMSRNCSHGVVIGRLLDGPLESFVKLGNCCVDMDNVFGLKKLEERRDARQVFNPSVFFNITLADLF